MNLSKIPETWRPESYTEVVIFLDKIALFNPFSPPFIYAIVFLYSYKICFNSLKFFVTNSCGCGSVIL